MSDTPAFYAALIGLRAKYAFKNSETEIHCSVDNCITNSNSYDDDDELCYLVCILVKTDSR